MLHAQIENRREVRTTLVIGIVVDMELIRQYSVEETEQLRNKIIDENIEPYVKAVFDFYPDFNSAALLVAQYWDDEAIDAVHSLVMFSVLSTPDFESFFKSTESEDCDEEDPVNTPGDIPNFEWGNFEEPSISKVEEEVLWGWDDNNSAIPAFAGYCKEGAGQCDDYRKSYARYAIFRRVADEIVIEVVGKKIRPWLDGVEPDWAGYESD